MPTPFLPVYLTGPGGALSRVAATIVKHYARLAIRLPLVKSLRQKYSHTH